MTKQDFIAAAALQLIALRPNKTMSFIAEEAKKLADEVFSGTPLLRTDFESDPIENVAIEAGKVELQMVKEKRRTQSSGIDVRLRNAFYAEGIETVGDLLKHGRVGMLRARNVGKLSVECIEKALENLYGIMVW